MPRPGTTRLGGCASTAHPRGPGGDPGWGPCERGTEMPAAVPTHRNA
eukprot:CAMPEP_0197881448 /NCGR_PEP_ID=MMETSP1439-20131203/8930_1 /TAXON_ID=66791 /ORGANISM="Gonyaulax spinifera, Strain CCMP409" /LENGTH=46 /DNA_ID= /DNA_START= /DNA_END= /DNA_ORIENTATION=